MRALLENLLKVVHAVQSYIWPSQVYDNEFDPEMGLVYVAGWDATLEEEQVFVMTPEQLKRALGVTQAESKWVYTPRGLLHRLDTFVHQESQADRIIAVLCNDHPMKMPSSFLRSLSLVKKSDIRRILETDPTDTVELLWGDMTIERL